MRPAVPGSLLGKRVLVTGSGPIGALAMLVARQAGAREVVATDITDAPLEVARQIGADAALNTLSEPEALARYKADKGYFETVFEASRSVALTGAMDDYAAPAAPSSSSASAGGEMSLEINHAGGLAKSLFARHLPFSRDSTAVDFLASGSIDVAPLLTEIVPLAEAVRAFDLAGDRSRAMKVQLAL